MFTLDQLKNIYPPNTPFNCIYDRDSIHEVMKRGSIPAGWLFSNEDDFLRMPHLNCISAAIEECYVQSIVQYMIPFNGSIKSSNAFELTLNSLTCGPTWFNKFSASNNMNIKKLFDNTYIDTFWYAVADGKLKVAGAIS